MHLFKRILRGQGLVEYALTITLVATAIVFSLGFVIGGVNSIFSTVTSAIGGGPGPLAPPPPPGVTLDSIVISPSSSSVHLGDPDLLFTATGTYSDGSTLDITSLATTSWTSSDPAVATISSGGAAHPLILGPSTITATSGAISGHALLNVRSGDGGGGGLPAVGGDGGGGLSSKQVFDFAGNGGDSGANPQYPIMDATGTNAWFGDLFQIAVGPISGDIYVVESGTGDVRKITAGAVVTTLATLPGLTTPFGVIPASVQTLALDSNENVYVASSSDGMNYEIYRIDHITGHMTGLVDTNGAIGNPSAIAIDPADPGNLYVSGILGSSGVILKVDLATSQVLTVAIAGFLNTPQGITFDASGNAFVVDTTTDPNHPHPVVLKFTAGEFHPDVSPIFSDIFPVNPVASLNGITIDPAGNLYVTDTFGPVIYKITTAGTPSIFAGTLGADYGNPGLPIDGKLAGAYGVGRPSPVAELEQPRGIAIDSAGNFYVSDYQVIRKIMPNNP